MDVESAMRIISDQRDQIINLEQSNLQKNLIIEQYVQVITNIPTTIPGNEDIVPAIRWIEWAKTKLGYYKNNKKKNV